MSTCTKVHLYISCSNLVSKDYLSKSDPFAVAEIQTGPSKWSEIDRTETIQNNSDPEFEKCIQVDYFFEEMQRMRVSLYDSDSSSLDLKAHDYIGSIEFELGALLTSKQQRVRLNLSNSDKDTFVMVRGEQIMETRDHLLFRVSAADLDKKDFFGKSDPYFQLFHRLADHSLLQVFESEVHKNTLNPHFSQQKLSMEKLCNNDLNAIVALKMWDWDSNSAPDLIGDCEFSVQQLLDTPGLRIPLVNPHKVGQRNYKNSGELRFEHTSIVQVPTFLDYLQGGCQVNLMVAVDLTGSNGDPQRRGTKHYRSGELMNDYQQAIWSIGNILAPYDSDQKFHLWGFGARPSRSEPVSHCFSMNFDERNPQVEGVKGMLRAYDRALERVTLSGPTYLSEILDTAAAVSMDPEVWQEEQHYGILLVLTDGVINDMKETIGSVIRASGLPLSVILVGIGGEDFGAMEELDGDGGLLQQGGRQAERDIVQFVPMRECGNGSRLAKLVLAEVPGQFLEFMESKKIRPNEPLM